MRQFLACLMLISTSAFAQLAELVSDYDATVWQNADEKSRMTQLQSQLDAVNAMDASSEVLMWRGAIGASVAREKGGVGALGIIKQAKNDLEAARKADGNNHMAGAILANLLAKAPGWPLSVGNKKKAKALFIDVLQVDPNNILALQGYGELMVDAGQVDEARGLFERALQLNPRPGREMADQARQEQIRALLAAL